MPSQNAQAIQKESTPSQGRKRSHKASLDKIILLSHSHPERNVENKASLPSQAILKGLARLKCSSPLYKAEDKFSLLTEECLTFQPVSPVHPNSPRCTELLRTSTLGQKQILDFHCGLSDFSDTLSLGRCQFYNSLTIKPPRKTNPPTSTAATCRVSHCLTSARRPPGLS